MNKSSRKYFHAKPIFLHPIMQIMLLILLTISIIIQNNGTIFSRMFVSMTLGMCLGQSLAIVLMMIIMRNDYYD